MKAAAELIEHWRDHDVIGHIIDNIIFTITGMI